VSVVVAMVRPIVTTVEPAVVAPLLALQQHKFLCAGDWGMSTIDQSKHFVFCRFVLVLSGNSGFLNSDIFFHKC
jgi:hypothetical protein